MSYTKLHESLVHSTIWREPNHVRVVWITMMALADKNGEIQASIPGLADLARVSIQECEEALDCFQKPDPYSRSKDFNGRRIEEIEGGWALLNHPKYRALASKEDSKEKAAERAKRHRNRQTPESVTRNAPSRNVTVSRDIAEADTEADTDTGSSYTPPPAALDEIMPTGAAKDMLALQAKIQGIKPSWKTAFTRMEQQHLMDNAGFIADLTEQDWQLLKDYMAAKVPQEKAFWQPYNRSKFIETIGDVYDSATRWRQKYQDRRPAPTPVQQKAERTYLTKEQIKEMLKP